MMKNTEANQVKVSPVDECEHDDWVSETTPGGIIRQTCLDCGESALLHSPEQFDLIGY